MRQDKLVLLAYVYGDELKTDNGRVWSVDTGLRMAVAYPGVLLRGRGLQDLPVEPSHEAFTARRAASAAG